MLSLPTSRAARIGAQAAVLLALVGGTAAYAANDTKVQLTVDGQEQEVRVFGTTVDDVLKAADVEVGKRDVVAPALGEGVSDGDNVVVRHARLLTVTVDGKTQEHWTTALTVDEALEDLNIRADGARLSASRSTPLGRKGLSLEIVTAKAVTVLADGASKPLVSTAATVGDLLAEAGVTPGPADRVSVPVGDPVTDGMTVQVVRIAQQQVTETQEVGFETEKVENGDLYKGETKVQTKGAPGVRTITWVITTADGVEESRAVASDVVTTQPVKEVVLVGTKEKPAAPSAPSAAAVPSGSVWDRLAQCESGGNWSINTGNGYYGGLQFSLSTWRAYGGAGYPHETSREYQISIAEKVQASQGWGAWPSCSSKLGLR